jgi:Nitrile hydratase, alpha chain
MATERGQQANYNKRWGQIVAQAWADDAFKERLLAEPKAVLQEHGILVPAGSGVRVLEPPEQAVYFVLPPRPRGELTDEQLDRVVAGGGLGWIVGDLDGW